MSRPVGIAYEILVFPRLKLDSSAFIISQRVPHPLCISQGRSLAVVKWSVLIDEIAPHCGKETLSGDACRQKLILICMLKKRRIEKTEVDLDLHEERRRIEKNMKGSRTEHEDLED